MSFTAVNLAALNLSANLPNDAVDVIVVGSGAAGSAMAALLAEGGKRVLILEAGPATTQANMVSSPLYARRLKWSGTPVIEEGKTPISHVFNSGYGIGGSAAHHYGVWPRLHVEDFEMQTRYKRGLNWPIKYTDLAPYYDRVQVEAGVSGDAKLEIWRPPGEPYPMPPAKVFEQGQVLARGFEKLGKTVAPLPLAVTSVPYKDRPACLWDGWCDAGCPIGALANPLTVHLPRAYAKGATLVADAVVTRVLTDATGERATGVEVVTLDGARRTLKAALVVLATFSIENPRLLLASATDKHPQGLGNRTGFVGRYVMTHMAGVVSGIFDEETRYYMGALGGQLVNQDSYPKLTHEKSGAFGSYQWIIAQAVKPNDLLGVAMSRAGLYGAELQGFMKRATRGFATMTAVCEGIPVADNRVTLADTKDKYGVPQARVTHTAHAESAALWQASVTEGKAVITAAGSSEVWNNPAGSMHIMGGTVMGNKPADSVTNSFGQVHDIANLVLAGPGLFPTSGGVNPTFTVHAVTARSAEHLLANWNKIAA
ncbi:MAG: GMC family oxidoreductase [Gammaproteobacteria bacterium]